MPSPSPSPRSLRVWPAGSAEWHTCRPGEIPLRQDEVHVWVIPLTSTPEQIASSSRLLSVEERERAARFVFEDHRWRWIQARAQWRRLLGAYLDCPPETVELEVDARGKPRIRGSGVDRRLELNLSHSGELALFAIAIGRRVGVDVEVIRPRLDVASLATRVLTESERAPLRELDGYRLEQEFLRCWTRKEAWIKALGDGLARDLQSFEVLAGENVEEARPSPKAQPSPDEPEADGLWWLQDLTPGQHAVGCVAAEGSRPEVRLLTLAADSSW